MNEDMILPNDFVNEDAQPQAQDINNEQVTETTEQPDYTNEGEQVEEVTTQEETSSEVDNSPRIKVKYNHEERELTLEEATQLAQKGMNYDKLQEKINSYQNDPGLQYLNEIAQKNNTSVEELVSYWKEQEQQAQLNELIQQNIPEEYAREMLENRKFREQLQQQEKQKAQTEKQNAEYMEFFENFPGVEPKDIPPEVFVRSEQEGIPLKYAYMEHERNTLMNRVKMLEQNNKNIRKAPLSAGVSSHGSQEVAQEDDFLKGFNSF